MRLTLHTDYALRLLMFLAVDAERVVTLADVAEAYGISKHHLAKVAQTLRAAGYVDAHRGQGGGLRIGKAAESIRLGDVVRLTEPDFALVECFDPAPCACPLTRACELANVLDRAQRAFLGELDQVTLSDLISRPTLRDRLVSLHVS